MHPRIHAQSHPDKPALIMAESGETVTYGELEARANRAARALRSLGLGIGDTVAMSCDNRPEFFDIYWAAQRSGIMLVPISTRLKAEELAYIINDSGAKVLLIAAPLEAVARGIEAHRSDVPGLAHILTIGAVDGFAEWGAACAQESDQPLADEALGGRMVYSSGTTGRPKGIRFPSAGGTPIQPNPAAAMFGNFYGLGADTIYLSPAPLYHASPMGFTTAVQSLGGTPVVMRKFDPEGFLAAIERYAINVTQVVPTMFIRLLGLPDEARARYDLGSLEQMIHAAAPCPIPVKRAMIDWLGPIIVEFYAGSEGNGYVMLGSEEWLAHPGSVGKAVIGTIHICGDDGEELPTGEIGTIYFSGGKPFSYHNDEERTAATRNPNHADWTTMGDVGRLDEDGYLYLSDRKDFMIISGGVNIYPQEVENLLITHPKVADAAVFGVPNADFGEEVKAVVQPKDWADAGADFEADLIGWCRENIADVKAPRSIDFERELPRAETGKLYKKDLKARYWPAA